MPSGVSLMEATFAEMNRQTQDGEASTRNPKERARRMMCRTCGTEFDIPSWRSRYCSKQCKTKSETARHTRYVNNNRQHIRDYLRNWRHARWGESNAEIARKAERLALEKILPSLGFAEVYDVTRVRRFMPFDFIGTWNGERVLVDVTTSISKTGSMHRSAIEIANALGMRLLTLFVKPDLSSFHLADSTKVTYVRFKELIPVG